MSKAAHTVVWYSDLISCSTARSPYALGQKARDPRNHSGQRALYLTSSPRTPTRHRDGAPPEGIGRSAATRSNTR
jgi:hypothetical protein